MAASKIFAQSPSSRDKSCPRDAFLGLCEHGCVVGVAQGNYTRSVSNKRYAVAAVAILKKNPELSECDRDLWKAVTRGASLTHNGQMDVVNSLFRAGHLK